MTCHDLEGIALALVTDGKGILAADETVPTLTRRFDALGIESTEQSRRAYREMLFASPGTAEFVSGAIMYDETIRQKSSGGTPLAEVLESEGILPGIKVDLGAMAGGLPCNGSFAEPRLHECQCWRARTVRGAVPRARDRTDRRARSSHGRVTHDRTLRGGHRQRPSFRF